jgi:hypothetical protein
MRYIYYIVFIVAAFSAAIGYELFSSRVPQKDVALSINDRVVTAEEFDRLYASRPQDIAGKEEFINSFIMKELLIQESQREGIDKEKSFRRSIQNFYEQSLIKLLMDRKFASYETPVSEEELDRYLSLVGSKLVITTFSVEGAGEARMTRDKEGQRSTVLFDDLSGELQNAIVRTKEGETTAPFSSGDKFVAVRLDKVDSSAPRSFTEEEKATARRMLVEQQKERAIRDWTSALRKKASIKINVSEENRGDK